MRLTLWMSRSWERSLLIGPRRKSHDKLHGQSLHVANGAWRAWDRSTLIGWSPYQRLCQITHKKTVYTSGKQRILQLKYLDEKLREAEQFTAEKSLVWRLTQDDLARGYHIEALMLW